MRTGRLAIAVLLLAAACGTSGSSGSPDNGGDPIHPQPQPNDGTYSITAPCNAVTCGDAPPTFQYPRCLPKDGACRWIDQQAVSYQPCAPAECGEEPTNVSCPAPTEAKGNTCGAENDGSCVWTTACALPRSTTPCPDSNGCGDAVPALGVVCKDGDAGSLACFLLATGKCGFQPTCD